MRADVSRWLSRRTYTATDYQAAALAAAKGAQGRTVSVVLPALNEERTVGGIVEEIRRELVERHPLVDELVVIDSGSTDQTVVTAASAGARVVRVDDVLPERGHVPGKGEALWKSLHVTDGDLVVFIDSDLISFDPQFVVGLLGPLLTDSTVGYVKGLYDRPLSTTEGLVPSGGGRGDRADRAAPAGRVVAAAVRVRPAAVGRVRGPARPAGAGSVRLALRRGVRSAHRPRRAGRGGRPRAGRPGHAAALAPARRRARTHGRPDRPDRAGPLPRHRGAERPAGPVRADRWRDRGGHLGRRSWSSGRRCGRCPPTSPAAPPVCRAGRREDPHGRLPVAGGSTPGLRRPGDRRRHADHELRRRGHRVVLATVAESEQDADGRVSAFPRGQFARLAAPYPEVVGAAHAHARVVVEEIGLHAAAGQPFDLVHTHLEVVGPAVLGALGDAAPPVLHTLHWDLRRNADFYESFDGRGRVFFAGVSDSQIERGPTTLRRQTLGSVPLSVPIPDSRRRRRRSGPTRCWCCPGCVRPRASTSRCGPARRPGCRWCWPDRSVVSPTVPRWRARSPTPRARCGAIPTSAGSSTTSHLFSTGTGSAGSAA